MFFSSSGLLVGTLAATTTGALFGKVSKTDYADEGIVMFCIHVIGCMRSEIERFR